MTGTWLKMVALGAAVAASIGCTDSGRMWRDQYVFVGDDGDVVALVLQRRADGDAEAKAWFGGADGWGATFYHHFSVSGRRARDPRAALGALSASAGSPVRATLEAVDDGLTLGLRTRSSAMTLRAEELVSLGTATDPEGMSSYRVGRATLTVAPTESAGWLVVETTPARRPRRAFVEYGDFVFLVVAAPESGPLVLKQSNDDPAFDTALSLGHDSPSSMVRVTRDDPRVHASVVDFGADLDLEIRDRDGADGVAPDGSAVRYETMLLGGSGWAGVAFTIGPRN